MRRKNLIWEYFVNSFLSLHSRNFKIDCVLIYHVDLIFLSASFVPLYRFFLASKNNLELQANPKEAYRFQPNRLLTFVK